MSVSHMAVLLVAAGLANGCAAGAELSCAYVPRATAAEPQPELTPFERCAEKGPDGRVTLLQEHFEALDFDARGLAALRIADTYYYVRRDGCLASVVAHDNWADDFSEGLVRTERAGKIGYLDERLAVVIPPRYDWAFPFAEGRALVCTGCQREKPNAEGHQAVTGGVWGYIDKAGREVVPVRYSRDELRALSR